MPRFLSRLSWAAAALAGAGLFIASTATAQIPFPPATVFGSITDSAGPVPEKLKVEAYVGDTLCGEGETGFTGDGNSRVTVYFADVVSDTQTAGCGKSGADVRLKIGDRFATQTFKWEAGAVQLNVVFGDATPAAIPTFTPTPPRTATPAAGSTESPQGGQGGGAVETIPAGSPGAGSPVPRSGGITSSTPATGESSDDGGGFPIWAVAVLVLGGVAVVGGGIGFAMSRTRTGEEDDLFPGTPTE